MLSEQIKLLRLARGINQVELADALSVTKQSVSNWENNNIQPSIEILIKLADFFKVSTDYLLGRENETQLNVSGLSQKEIQHLALLVNDLTK